MSVLEIRRWEVSTDVLKLVRAGGEVSMWSDDYVFPAECNAFPGRVPANGSVFYQRSLDDAFGRSIGGLMWPRGFVAAGAYYRFNASLNVSTPVSVRLRVH